MGDMRPLLAWGALDFLLTSFCLLLTTCHLLTIKATTVVHAQITQSNHRVAIISPKIPYITSTIAHSWASTT